MQNLLETQRQMDRNKKYRRKPGLTFVNSWENKLRKQANTHKI